MLVVPEAVSTPPLMATLCGPTLGVTRMPPLASINSPPRASVPPVAWLNRRLLTVPEGVRAKFVTSTLLPGDE